MRRLELEQHQLKEEDDEYGSDEDDYEKKRQLMREKAKQRENEMMIKVILISVHASNYFSKNSKTRKKK